MLDDQAMADQWIIRVQGREYGPVDFETLREWKTEGRVLPGNEARPADSDLWATAADIVELDFRTLVVAALGLCMLVLSLASWPVFIAGIQILTAELSAGREARLFKLFPRILKFWPRVAILCIFVYGIFLVLTLFGLFIAAIPAVAGPSLFAAALTLGLLVVQVWMFGWFFVNVLFWQQFAVLADADPANALRQSKELARSGHDLPWFERPLWRGVLIASIWFAVVLVLQIGAEWNIIQQYFHELSTTQDPRALLQKLAESQRARGFDLLSFGLNVMQQILRPLVGIAFVVLYFESQAASGIGSSRREVDTRA